MIQPTGISDIANEIKWAIIQNWRKENIGFETQDTSPRIRGMQFQTVPTSQTWHTTPFYLTIVAERWRSINVQLLETHYNYLPISAFDPTFLERCTVSFDEEVNKFCLQHDIEDECAKYYEFFFKTFTNIQRITINVSHDYELEEYSKINFVLTLSDEIENILKYENEFKLQIRKEIDKEKRRFFTYNYNLI